MPELNAHLAECPKPDDVRVALKHMAESEAFRGSPQLIAFLRYVVEATLRGDHDRIKGYTIAVEALGRAEDFDPQSDPIVRVEAIRLRRAITRYHAASGGRDPVAIDLPLGSYVPVFRRGTLVPKRPATPERIVRGGAAFDWRGANWRRMAAALALVLLGAGIYAALDFRFDFNTPSPQPVSLFAAAQPRAEPIGVRAMPAYPVVFVGPFQSVDRNGAAASPADALRGKLRDALARFDEIEVVSAPLAGEARDRTFDPEGAPATGHYRLTASVESGDAGVIGLGIRLTDALDGRVAYARSFGGARRDGETALGEETIVREVSAALAQPYGIIQAHERARDVAGETQYRCLIEAHDYWRNYDPQQHRRARDCLERATETAPGFALGYAALAPIVLEEYRSGMNPRPNDPPALQRALAAARRAVELKPGSARAHQALSNVQFARGDYPLAIEAGERAVVLNPYDPTVLADYGGILVALGEQARGARMIREAAGAIVVRPGRHDFFLFLTAHLAGDWAGAARYAALIASDNFPLGLMARALVARQRGESETARRLIDRLAALRPAWRSDYRAELKKYFPAETIVERLSHDLDQIGYIPGQ
jgi:tetratricopeptide (TPR) repeat protein